MQDFANYLVSKRFTSKKVSHFYKLWIINLYDFIGKKPGNHLEKCDIDYYIKKLSKSKMEWQVKQAQEAIRLYLYYLKRPQTNSIRTENDNKAHWKAVASEMVNVIRLKQLSLQTERTYMQWLKRFYLFLAGRSPYLIDNTHVIAFLTHLAVDRRVAPSTQNQALNALLFFCVLSAGMCKSIFFRRPAYFLSRGSYRDCLHLAG